MYAKISGFYNFFKFHNIPYYSNRFFDSLSDSLWLFNFLS